MNKPADFKGSIKYAIRYIPNGKYYSSARYANFFANTPTLVSDKINLENKIKYWCTNAWTKLTLEGNGIEAIPSNFEIVEYKLVETGTTQCTL